MTWCALLLVFTLHISCGVTEKQLQSSLSILDRYKKGLLRDISEEELWKAKKIQVCAHVAEEGAHVRHVDTYRQE